MNKKIIFCHLLANRIDSLKRYMIKKFFNLVKVFQFYPKLKYHTRKIKISAKSLNDK